jgi:hypothetical protein
MKRTSADRQYRQRRCWKTTRDRELPRLGHASEQARPVLFRRIVLAAAEWSASVTVEGARIMLISEVSEGRSGTDQPEVTSDARRKPPRRSSRSGTDNLTSDIQHDYAAGNDNTTLRGPSIDCIQYPLSIVRRLTHLDVVVLCKAYVEPCRPCSPRALISLCKKPPPHLHESAEGARPGSLEPV